MCVYSQYYNKEIQANLNAQEINGLIQLDAFATNKTEVNSSVRYVFSIIYPNSKSDTLKKEVTEGRLVINPNEKIEVLSTTLDKEVGEKKIILRVERACFRNFFLDIINFCMNVIMKCSIFDYFLKIRHT